MTIIFKMRKQFKQNSSKIEMVRDFWQKFTCFGFIRILGIIFKRFWYLERNRFKTTSYVFFFRNSSLIKARANNRVLDSWTYRKWSTREKTVFFWVSNSSERLKPSKEVKKEKKRKKKPRTTEKKKHISHDGDRLLIKRTEWNEGKCTWPENR